MIRYLIAKVILMESKIAGAIKLNFEPVAIIWSDKKPDGALQFKSCGGGCIMTLFAQAARGKTSAISRTTFGCPGGGMGMGFGNTYENFSLGGVETFKYFLSTGVEGRRDDLTEKARGMGRGQMAENLLKGEGYKKTPELVEKFLQELPAMSIPSEYVILKPLKDVGEGELPVVVVFVANPDQLSALITLANYDVPGSDNVIMPPGAGCHQIGIYAFKESLSEKPRAVMGMTDISARKNVRQLLGSDVFTFAVPFLLFRKMEENVEASFLSRSTWRSLVQQKD